MFGERTSTAPEDVGEHGQDNIEAISAHCTIVISVLNGRLAGLLFSTSLGIPTGGRV